MLKTILVLCFGILFSVPLFAKTPPAQYQKACAICHEKGRFGAPRAGVPGDWAKRLNKGMSTLVEHVEKGYKAMPPGGLCETCSGQDYKTLIQFMSTEQKDDS